MGVKRALLLRHTALTEGEYRAFIFHQLYRTLAMVKPDAFKNLGKIINAIYQSGFVIR